MKTKSFFEKLKALVESTTMESATFPYKTALSKANVKTKRMDGGGERRGVEVQNGPITKNPVLPLSTVLFQNLT